MLHVLSLSPPFRSTLVLEGEGLFLESLELDGALMLTAGEGARVYVRGLKIENAGSNLASVRGRVNPIRVEDR